MIKKIVKTGLIIFFLILCLPQKKSLNFSFRKTGQIVNIEPKNKAYFTDETKYLKTFYLLGKGFPYYQAHYQAMKQMAGEEAEVWTKDAWGWRLPTVFYFWKFFTNQGEGIFNLFLFMSFLTFINAFLIAKKFVSPKLALLASFILIPYFFNALKSTSFLFITWWALFFFILGLTCFFYQKLAWSTLFFTLSIITREHFIIPFIFMFLISYFFKKKKYPFLIPIIIFFLVAKFHSFQVEKIVNLSHSLGLQQRLGGFSKKLLLATLSFSTNLYFSIDWRPALIWLSFALVGLISLTLKSKDKYLPLIALASFSPLIIILPFMCNSTWQDYWGVFYVPTGAIFSLTIFRLFKEKVNEKK